MQFPPFSILTRSIDEHEGARLVKYAPVHRQQTDIQCSTFQLGRRLTAVVEAWSDPAIEQRPVDPGSEPNQRQTPHPKAQWLISCDGRALLQNAETCAN